MIPTYLNSTLFINAGFHFLSKFNANNVSLVNNMLKIHLLYNKRIILCFEKLSMRNHELLYFISDPPPRK